MVRQDHPLRVARVSRNLSIQEVANATGLGRNTVLRAEQGHAIHPSSRRLLCEFFQMGPADLGLLPGEIFFDTNDYEAAQSCYSFAATVASDTQHYDLWACALIRNTFLPLYEQQYSAAFPLIRQARRIANRGDSTLVTRFWAAAVEAEAQAGMQSLPGCQRALDFAQGVEHSRNGANGTWLRFDGDRLPEQRGACFVKLGHPKLAELALHTALEQVSSLRRRGLILGDLALAALQQQEVERACSCGHALVAAYQTGKSGVLEKSIIRLQKELRPYQQTAPVREFSQRVQFLQRQKGKEQ
jgi:transcriptional regulator with XRE-family HTH domain